MSSWLVRLFMSLKIEVAIDESCRKERRSLDLSHTNLKRIPTAVIGRLYHSKVRVLLLQKNYLNELPESFGLTMKKLELLTLDYNELAELPSSFCLMQNLIFLNISNNLFEQFPPPLFTLRNLRTLWANGIGVKDIPDEIAKMRSLRFLGLRNNSLTEISQGICLLKRLKWLTFANNEIQTIPFELSNLKALIHLNLNSNKIATLPDIWSELPELSFLFLQSNLILVDRSVIRQIRELPKLKRAHLQGNRVRTTNEIYEHIIVPVSESDTAPTTPMSTDTTSGEPENERTAEERLVASSNVVETAEEIVEETTQTANSNNQTFEAASSSTGGNFIQDHSNMDPEIHDDIGVENGTIRTSPEGFQNIENPIHGRNNSHQNPVFIGNQQNFENPGDELLDFQETWEYSESTNSLDDNISGSDDSDFEELPLDSTHVTFGLWGILTS